MFLKILLNLIIVFLVIVTVVILRSNSIYKKNPLGKSNIKASSDGLLSIIHENNSKTVSDSVKGAEEALKMVTVRNDSIDVFLKSLNK